MEFELIWRHWDLYLEGLGNTLTLVLLSLIIGGALAIPLALIRAYQQPFLNPIVFAYTYVFRGTPLLVQLYLIYFGLGQFEAVRESAAWVILRDAYWCSLIAFTLNTAAYTTEILRGAIETTPFGEIEAAKASGMSAFTRVRRIILPSAVRRALPAYSNEVIFMLHSSVLASTVTVIDILGAGRTVNAKYYVAYEGFLSAALLYMILVYIISRLFKLWEHHWHAHLRPRPEANGPAAAAATAA